MHVMHMQQQLHGSDLIVRLEGELDLVAAEEFRRRVDQVLEHWEPAALYLDVRGVTFIDSSGLGAILGRYKRITQRQGRMVIVGAQPPVRHILELTGFPKIIPLLESDALPSSPLKEAK